MRATLYKLAATAATAALLPNGKVYLMTSGSLYAPPDTPSQTMLYDPTDGSFRPVGAPVGLLYGPIILLSDGNLLLGGNANQTEVYSPGSNSFTASAPIPSTWGQYGAVLLNTGDVLLAGGNLFDASGNRLGYGITSAEIYHPATATPVPALGSANDQGQGAIWNSATGVLASAANPVTAGTFLSMYTNNLIAGHLPGHSNHFRLRIAGRRRGANYWKIRGSQGSDPSDAELRAGLDLRAS